MNINEVEALSSRQEKLNYLKGLPFEATISQREGKHYLRISELSLIASNESLEKAISDLDVMKYEYFDHMISLGSEADVILASKKGKSQFYFNDLKSSLIKYVALFILITATLGIGSCTARNILLGGITKIPKIIERERKQISKKISSATKAIKTESPEKKKIRVEKFKESVDEIQPYIDILKNAFK